jgi:RNA polymerase subunit RPABC4/transcription elongation factor Spt4
LTGTYVACLDCGHEFAYDWQEMKVITSPERHRERAAQLAKHAA